MQEKLENLAFTYYFFSKNLLPVDSRPQNSITEVTLT